MGQSKYTNGLFNMVLIKYKQEKTLTANGFIYTKYTCNNHKTVMQQLWNNYSNINMINDK